MNRELLAVVLVALVGLVGVSMVGGMTGAAIQIIEVRDYESFSERLCPDPENPVPVLVQTADLPGTTGKTQFVKCQSGPIVSNGLTFYPEVNRKQLRYAYGHEKFYQL